MTINWDQLRTWNGSVATAFEELCCQLAACEAPSHEARFFRKGTPDAGVECYWQLGNGREWAWQAKWFRSSPAATQWQELDASVATALEKHPQLSKYTICLPIDRSDARIRNQKSCLTKWHERVTKWKRLAEKKGMDVTFSYWGESEIGARLSSEEHRGRHWFWFNEERFSHTWFRDRVEGAIENARDRYSPSLHIDLPVRANLDSLGRTPAYFKRLSELYSQVSIALSKLRCPDGDDSLKNRYEELKCDSSKLLSQLLPWATIHAPFIEWSATRPIPWDSIAATSQSVSNHANTIIAELYKQRNDRREQPRDQRVPQGSDNSFRLYLLQQFEETTYRLASYAKSEESRLSNLPALLLVGEAGQGKTHLLCHVAHHDAEASMPRLLFHGERFTGGDPWFQMIRQLGLDCSREQFLGALEAAGQASHCRVILLLDALNEGEGKRLWWEVLPELLTVVARSKWLGICLTVRDLYEELIVPPTLDATRLLRVRHEGFSGVEHDATTTFFEHFNIEPSTPLLLPEFTNPLFLKLFCEGLHNAETTRVPIGLRGITSVFRFYITSLDSKLSRPDHLNYDKRKTLVRQAIDRLADEMAKNAVQYLALDDAANIVDQLLPRDGHDNTLFHHLESEGVVTVVPDPDGAATEAWTESVRFTYQRLADHLVAERLLRSHLELDDVAGAFSNDSSLGRLLKDECECYQNRGLLEAFAIQVPELTNRELPELAHHVQTARPMREAFVASLIWRHPESFGPETSRYIDDHVRSHPDTFDGFWEAIIGLATTPTHPLNADHLHSILVSYDLAARDEWWSTWLHWQWGHQGAVDRLVEWAWNDHDKSAYDDEVIRLAGVTLGWFLTTAHRFLRDQATKALVRLCENRLSVLRSLIAKFDGVDDPYVIERLFACAYGVAMRTDDTEGLKNVATDVFCLVFETGPASSHILIRDYARGVIETALHRCPTLELDVSQISPPYSSDWPGLTVPDAEEIQRLGSWQEGMADEMWARVNLYHSVATHDDFSRYVIGDLMRWSSQKLGANVQPTRKESFEKFVESLTQRQREAWDAYCSARSAVHVHGIRLSDAHDTAFDGGKTYEECVALESETERALRARLRNSSKKLALLENVVMPYLSDPHEETRRTAFDGEFARRWILQRILDMGWTVERFGKFDRSIRDGNRDANKPERIGKKYQWIAYHELLGRLSDNFELRNGSWSGEIVDYDEPSDAGASRDIDPSNLLRKTERDEWGPFTNTWWFPVTFESWDSPVDENEWLRLSSDIPNVEDLLQVNRPDDNSDWLTLNGFYHWEQPTPVGIDRHDFSRRELWYAIRCYFVRACDSESLMEWARRQRWQGDWMPKSTTSYGVFLGEMFWSRAFNAVDNYYHGRPGWTRGDNDTIPVDILVADDEYAREARGFDCSLDEGTYISLPCRFLVDEMGLTWRGREGCWYDTSGQLVAFDPSVNVKGPQVLLANKSSLLRFLNDQQLRLFWTVVGEKRTMGGAMWSEVPPEGSLEIHGSYLLNADQLSGYMRYNFQEPRKT